MEVINGITGLSLIGIGFLVKAFPDLISGYSTMTKEQKANVDIKGFSSFIKKGFIVIGLTIIVGYYFFNWIGLSMIANSIILISVLGGTFILSVKSRKFDRNESNEKYKASYIILGIVVLFVFSLLYYGSRPAEILISKESVLIKGMYGLELSIKDIQKIELIEKIPTITLRTNGFSFGSTNKGYFELEEYGKCRLFLHSNSNPYLIIIEKNGEKTIINHKDKRETKMEFERLKLLTANK